MLKWLRCWLGWCPGTVVSGTHEGTVWIGWRCADCRCVKHYAPSTLYTIGPT
jgi:hypothetical protein